MLALLTFIKNGALTVCLRTRSITTKNIFDSQMSLDPTHIDALLMELLDIKIRVQSIVTSLAALRFSAAAPGTISADTLHPDILHIFEQYEDDYTTNKHGVKVYCDHD